jgi:hypothetical protein
MGKVTMDLSAVELKAFETVQSVLSSYVKPNRLRARRNEQSHYFTIRLDDRRELCHIHRHIRGPLAGNLKHIYSRYGKSKNINIRHPLDERISSPNDILSLASKLVDALLNIASRNGIPLP